MKIHRVLLLFPLISLLSASALAQSSASVVKVSQSSVKVKKGGAAAGTITLTIDGGYHINSNRPSEKYLIPTTLKLLPLAGFTVGGVVYPKAKLQKFTFSEKPLSVYEGQVVLKFNVRAGAAAGSQTLKGKLTIQACNDQQCLRPQTVDVNIPVEVN
jgi:thioredoxin:protein disulfide reductase